MKAAFQKRRKTTITITQKDPVIDFCSSAPLDFFFGGSGGGVAASGFVLLVRIGQAPKIHNNPCLTAL